MRSLIILLSALTLPALCIAQETMDIPAPALEEYQLLRVEAIEHQSTDDAYGYKRIIQDVRYRVISGSDAGHVFVQRSEALEGRDDMLATPGEKIIASKLLKANGGISYVLREKYRLPRLVFLVVTFFCLALLIGGRTGLMSTVGLATSVCILLFLVIPLIIRGWNPLAVSLLGSVGIACTSLFLAHGFHWRTTVSLISTLATLGLSALCAIAAVSLSRIFGFGSEESVYLQTGLLGRIDLRGLLLAGIIIGSLGVLDDITTAQTAAVDEVRKANPRLHAIDLMRSGTSVGREHIASLINTLALAYIGTALPLLLILATQEGTPLWVILNSEMLAEELVRTLVGSTTLLFAVPISTYCAVLLLPLHPHPARHGSIYGHHH